MSLETKGFIYKQFRFFCFVWDGLSCLLVQVLRDGVDIEIVSSDVDQQL